MEKILAVRSFVATRGVVPARARASARRAAALRAVGFARRVAANRHPITITPRHQRRVFLSTSRPYREVEPPSA